jgi:nucleoid DNA-binding protein
MEKFIIQKLATKYNLPLGVVEKAVFHQFKYVTEVMKEGKFEAVRLPYFGKFWAKKGRIKHLNRKKADKDLREKLNSKEK